MTANWKLGANLNIIANQLGKAGTVWDLEWNNGTSFIFSRDEPVCKVLHFDVGILTPDWLAHSTHLGQTETDTFVCDVWTKADFINYYADVDNAKPVRWTFLWSSAEFHVLEFNENEALPKKLWQAPKYCFSNASSAPTELDQQLLANGRMFRLQAAQEVAAAAAAKQQQQQQPQQQQTSKVQAS
ncbi:hypothetical protein OEZ86_004870 [Tetradesmus obliquus]|nr:hypothetical protein OEZ86_004870 [Tetradesmus obliquus]